MNTRVIGDAQEASGRVPTPPEVQSGEIIRSLVGSTLHGIGRPDLEDIDLMGVCVEPVDTVLGLDRFEQWTWRTQPEGHRSTPGDIDITVYGLRKYLSLATKGNPTVLLLLFTPPEYLTIQTPLGTRLQALAPSIISRQVAGPFIGYANAQRDRLLGVRGGRHTNRPELVTAHGYDTKFAAHALRLCYQGEELLTTGTLTLPMAEHHRQFLLDVRTGQVPFDTAIEVLDTKIADLHQAADTSPLPEGPDLGAVTEFMITARLNTWNLPQ